MEALQQECCELVVIPSEDINHHWVDIAPFIEQCETPGWDVWDIRRALLKKEAQLWAVTTNGKISGIWITRIENSYSQRWGLVWVASGSGLENVDLYREHIEPWLREQGCSFIEVVGRKGWVKILPDYKEKGVILTKELS